MTMAGISCGYVHCACCTILGKDKDTHKDNSSLQFKNVRNGWVQNVIFSSVSGAINLDSTLATTVRNCHVTGKKGVRADRQAARPPARVMLTLPTLCTGHYGFVTRRSRGALFMDNASIQHHGTSCQAGDINTVIVRDKMIAGGSVDMVRDHRWWWSRAVTSGHQPVPMPLSQHGRYPAYTLLDNVMGGVFKGNGGDNVAMPHHPKGTSRLRPARAAISQNAHRSLFVLFRSDNMEL
jgi:hypothetical protein